MKPAFCANCIQERPLVAYPWMTRKGTTETRWVCEQCAKQLESAPAPKSKSLPKHTMMVGITLPRDPNADDDDDWFGKRKGRK